MPGLRYNNLGWFAKHPKIYELGTVLLGTLRRQAAEAVGIDKRMKVLDIACGTGALSRELAKLGHAVTGIDLDREMLNHAVKNTRPDSKKPAEFTFWINRKDGNRRCILGRVTATLHNNTVSTYITVTDITESTEREQALRDRIAALQKFIG